MELAGRTFNSNGMYTDKKKSTWKNSWKEEIWSVLRLFPRLPLLASVGDTMLN